MNEFEFYRIPDNDIYFAISLKKKMYIRILLFAEECSVSYVFNNRKVRDKYNNCSTNYQQITAEKFIEIMRQADAVGNNLPFVLTGHQNTGDLHPLQQYDGKINTLYGGIFDLLNPTPEMINIKDIASGLAHNGHFNGLSPQMFSIAQHSIAVYHKTCTAYNNPIFSMVALLHDAAEGYTGDIIKPIKVMWSGFDRLEEKIQAAIFKKYGLPMPALKIIKPIDIQVQKLEYEQFYHGANHFKYLTPVEARANFLDVFNEALEELQLFLDRNPDFKEIGNVEKAIS